MTQNQGHHLHHDPKPHIGNRIKNHVWNNVHIYGVLLVLAVICVVAFGFYLSRH